MAAELVGTAYVRIRAITAGLAKDISDGVDKGVKDAGPDVTKAGEGLGEDLGDGATKSFKGTMADGIGDALDAPAIHKASEDGGAGVAKDVSAGIEKENKRRNPFRSMLDAFKNLSFKDEVRAKASGIDRDLNDVFKNIDVEPPHLNFDTPSLHRDAEKGGKGIAQSTKKGFDDENKKSSPFASFAETLSKLAPKPINWLAIFGPTTLAPIVGTVVSLLGLIVEAAGFIVTAAAGAGVALAGIAAVALPGFAVLFAAFKTQTKQLEKFKESAKKLLKPWQQIGVATQKTLLPGLEKALAVISTKGGLVSMFTEFGGRIGRIVGDFAHFASVILTSERNTRLLGTILEASGTFFENMRTAALKFIDLLMPFLAAAAPLAVQFSESLASWAGGLADFINGAVQIDEVGNVTGTLAATFQTWYDRFVLLVGVIGDVFAGLWGILQIASTASTPFFDKIAEAAQHFRDWVGSAEGQNKIKDFFDRIQPVLDEVWTLLGNLFDLIVRPAVEGDGGAVMLDRLADALGAVNAVLENPLTAKIVPILLGIATGLTLLSLAGSGIVKIKELADNIKSLADTMWTLTGPFRAVGSAIADMSWEVVKALARISVAMLTSPAGLILLGIAVAVGAIYLAFKNWDKIVDFLKQAWEWFDKLSLPLKIVVGAFAVLILMINPVAQFAAAVLLVTAALKNWDKIAEFVIKMKDAVVEFIEAIPAMFGQALGIIEGVISSIPGKLAEFGNVILTFFAELPGKMKDALLAGIQALPGLILDAIAGLFEVGQNLVGLIADGLAFAIPRLLEFFVGLPGDILRVITRVLPTLLGIGTKIIGFIVSGLATALPKVLFFFLRLPFEVGTLIRKGLNEFYKLAAQMLLALLRGLNDNKGRILDFFKNLPGNLLHAAITAIKFLFGLGKDIIVALYNGVTNNIGALFGFFASLPSLLLGLIGDLASILFDAGGKLITGLLDGAKALGGSMDEFFIGIPSRLIGFIVAAAQAIIDVGLKIPGWIIEGVTTAASTIWDWFTALPGLIVDTLTGLADTIIGIGGSIIGWIVDGLVDMAQGLWDWVTEFPGNFLAAFDAVTQGIKDIGGAVLGWIVDGLVAVWSLVTGWVTGFPANFMTAFNTIIQGIKDIGGAIIGWIVDGFDAVWSTVTDWITKFPSLFLAGFDIVKDAIGDIGGAILGWIVDGFDAAWSTVTDWVADFPANLLSGFNTIIQGIKDIGKKIVGWIVAGIKAAPGAVIDAVTGLLPGPLKGALAAAGGILGVFGLEMGGIVPPTRFGTPIIAGENMRAEAVVPMTRPARALAVMQGAGLDQMVLNAYLGGRGGTAGGKVPTGDTTMLHIENAVMTSPVDADLVVQKITSAYNRLAS